MAKDEKEQSRGVAGGDGSLAWELIEKYGDTSADAITPECLVKFGSSISINAEKDVTTRFECRLNSSSSSTSVKAPITGT